MLGTVPSVRVLRYRKGGFNRSWEGCTAPLAGEPVDHERERALELTSEQWRARQQAGLASLMALATQVSLGVAEPASITMPAIPVLPQGPPRGVSDQRALPPGDQPSLSLGARLARLRTDHLLRNSLYLMLSSGIQAALGFSFWIVVARLFSTEAVGEASSLISASAFIAFLSLLGLNTALVRFLPSARNFSALISASFTLVAGCAAIGSLGYVVLMPVIAPRLAFVEHSPALILGFLVLSAATAVNLLTDSVFIATRKAGYCAVTDGVIGGLSKIVLGVALAGAGAYGVFSASLGGMAVAGVVSVILIIIALRWRPSLRNPLRSLRPVLKFSGANYISNAFNLLPTVIVPLIVLDRLGAQRSAYYYVAFQMALLLYAAVYAVESSFLAEVSQGGVDWRAVRRRSRRLAITLFVPCGIGLALAGHWVLLIFGVTYSQHSAGCLELLALAVIPIAAFNWALTILRISGRLRALMLSNAVYCIGICGSAWILSAHGLTALSASWLIGSSIAAMVSTVGASAAARRAARHRKTKTEVGEPRWLTSEARQSLGMQEKFQRG